MITGVSSASLYPLETERAVQMLGELGVRNIEIFVNDSSELHGDIRREIISCIKKYGMNIVSVHPFASPLETHFLFSDYKRRVETIMGIYREFFGFAREAGAKIFVLHGAYKGARCSDEEYAERYLMISDAAAEYGLTVALENVHYCKSGSVEFLEKLQSACYGRAKFVLDIKQAVRAGYDPKDFVKALGGDIIHLHVSDNRPDADCLPIGMGTYDFSGLLRDLKSVGFDGSMVLELYRRNYTEYSNLTNSINALENIIKANS